VRALLYFSLLFEYVKVAQSHFGPPKSFLANEIAARLLWNTSASTIVVLK
jgi:hypothetical protein